MRREAFEVMRELESFASRIKDEFNQARKNAQAPSEPARGSSWPKVDLSYDDAAVYIEADLPGMRKDAPRCEKSVSADERDTEVPIA